ncbi:hypothetical protein ACFRR6_24190 [Streptomyces sp. NPDC056891]|uniref:hypothetical protein n=1 Tax=Streptomyces sp. NPDC056891 TaxID=3345961 RepID=UPI0036B2FB80
MTLAELRTCLTELAELPDDTPVILAIDAEGNGFSPLDEAALAIYCAAGESGGEYRRIEDSRPHDGELAVFLWPTN